MLPNRRNDLFPSVNYHHAIVLVFRRLYHDPTGIWSFARPKSCIFVGELNHVSPRSSPSA